MHIVVCIKMVPDTTLVQIDPKTNTLVREGMPFITNPFDTHAVEEAVKLKDRYNAFVTVVSMGPPAAGSVLRSALSRGADHAVLLTDRAFGGADTLATSRVLAEAIRRLDEDKTVDVVLCGIQTIDGDTAQVGPGIASRLKYSQLTLIDSIINLDLAAKTIKVRRRWENYFEIIEAKLPALLTVVREINTPRYPTVPARLQAQNTSITTWSNDVLKLGPDTIGLLGSPTQVRRIFAPQREKGQIINGTAENKPRAVDFVVDKLFEWNIIT